MVEYMIFLLLGRLTFVPRELGGPAFWFLLPSISHTYLYINWDILSQVVSPVYSVYEWLTVFSVTNGGDIGVIFTWTDDGRFT